MHSRRRKQPLTPEELKGMGMSALWEVDLRVLAETLNEMESLARDPEGDTRTISNYHVERVLAARAPLEAAQIQARTNRRLVFVTWILAAATVALAIFTGLANRNEPTDLAPVVEAIERQCEANVAAVLIDDISDLVELGLSDVGTQLADGWRDAFAACNTDINIDAFIDG